MEVRTNKADDLVLEDRLEASATIDEGAGGLIKSILFAVHEDDGLQARLQTALAIARSSTAHLQLLHVVPLEAYSATDSYGGAFVSGEIVEALQEEANLVRARLEQHLKLEDVNWSYEVTTSVVTAELLQNASLADLVVIGREPYFHEFTRTGLSLLGELICSTRTPICIPGNKTKAFDPNGKAVIAWNGSIEAANAVRAAIGLLKMASDVRVIRYVEDKRVLISDTLLLEYLSRHGIHAEIETHSPRAGIIDDLVGYASKERAEYIVMGGYGHSRAGEFLFGGVTRALLRACDIALVIAH